MKKCPFCAEEIQDAAIVCRFCNRDLPATSEPAHPATTRQTLPPLRRPLPSHWKAGLLLAVVGALLSFAGRGTAAGFAPMCLWLGFILCIPSTWTVRIGGGFILAVLVFSIGLATNPPNVAKNAPPEKSRSPATVPTSAPSPPSAQIRAAVRFTGTQFVVENLGDDTWTEVEFEINGGVFSTGYVLSAATIELHHTYTVGALQFAKPDGARFNPFQVKPQEFKIKGVVRGQFDVRIYSFR